MLTEQEIEAVIGPLDGYAHQCHAASLALVKSGLLPGAARVARGSCRGVGGQHSWVVLGDPYDDEATIIDITLWSYAEKQPRVWIGTMQDGLHRPHGYGSIWQWGRPQAGADEPIKLEADLSKAARDFLLLCGPLDRRGWMDLFNSPMQGWPSREIVTAAAQDDRLRALIPIDIAGMVTDENPDNLYLRSP